MLVLIASDTQKDMLQRWPMGAAENGEAWPPEILRRMRSQPKVGPLTMGYHI